MGRGLRSACPSNIYHIYTRGVSGHVLFEHPDDKRKLLYQLEDSLDAYGGKLLAYCLMGNHFHLVINHNIEGVSKVVGVTKSRYARYYNHCYDRYGHLYQGRFGTMPALLQMRKMPLSIIRPLCLVDEADIIRYAELCGYEKLLKHCPYEHDTQRTTIAKLYNDIERMNPEARFSIWKALEREGKLTEEY